MKIKYTVTGLDCPNCAAKLATLIEGCDGITSAKINFLTEKLTVESELTEDKTLDVIKKVAKGFSKSVKVVI